MRKKRKPSTILVYKKEIDIKGVKWELEVEAKTEKLLTIATGNIKFFLDKKKAIYKVEKDGVTVNLTSRTRKIIESGNFEGLEEEIRKEELEKELGERAIV